MSILLEHAWAVTMDPAQPVLRDAFVAVEGSRIASVGTVRPAGDFDRVMDCRGKALLPGFVNAHTHLPMTLMRGYGGGHDLQHWLNDYIFPAEDKLDSRSVTAGTQLALAELIAAGVTCVADMYYFCPDIAQAVADSGLSANISRSVTCFAPVDDPADYYACRELRELEQQWNGYDDGRIRVDASVHGEYTSFSAPRMWEYLGRYAADHGLGMQVHVSETCSEHEECKARHGGKTPLQILDDYGVWQAGGLAAHCVWVSDEDMELMVRRSITAVHNPVSNLKLGSGVARVPALLRAGVNVALGTDGVASNNSHDMLEEIKLAAILHKGVNRDPMAVTARQALEMATVNGARALGRNTGVIAPGKDADLILIDLTRPELTPCHDVEENLVFSAHGSDVVMNMARGRVIYENGNFLTLDLERIRREMEEYALPRIFGA